MTTFLEKLNISEEEFGALLEQNTYFQGICLGYVAEHHALKFLQGIEGVESVVKKDDSDRSNRYDFLVTFKGVPVRIELKCSGRDGLLRLKCSDLHEVYTDAGAVRISDIPRGRFDLLAICTYNTTGKFTFEFILEKDLPNSTNKKLPEDLKSKFIKNLINVGTNGITQRCPSDLLEVIHQSSRSDQS